MIKPWPTECGVIQDYNVWLKNCFFKIFNTA
jgi:hypothetical protein